MKDLYLENNEYLHAIIRKGRLYIYIRDLDTGKFVGILGREK